MLKRISPHYVVNLDRLLSVNILDIPHSDGRCIMEVNIGSEEGKIKTDHVYFASQKEAISVLDKLDKNNENDDRPF